MNEENRSTARMTRQSFLKATALLPLAVLSSGEAAAAPQQDVTPGARPLRSFKTANAYFQLSLTAGEGLQTELVHTPSNLTLASADYSYSFGRPIFAGASSAQEGNTTLVNLAGDVGNGIEIRQRFLIPPDQPWVEE